MLEILPTTIGTRRQLVPTRMGAINIVNHAHLAAEVDGAAAAQQRQRAQCDTPRVILSLCPQMIDAKINTRESMLAHHAGGS